MRSGSGGVEEVEGRDAAVQGGEVLEASGWWPVRDKNPFCTNANGDTKWKNNLHKLLTTLHPSVPNPKHNIYMF